MPIPTPPTKPPDPFVLFVKAREGHIVRRFGSSASIGYSFTPGATKDQPSTQHWDTETIHAITAGEYALFAKEYDAELVDGGGLARCKREDWEKQRKAAGDAKAKAHAEREKPPTAPAGSRAP
jgi:hypothetical protein